MTELARVPMLTLNGKIINAFNTPEKVGKGGEVFDAKYRVQIMAEVVLQDGEKRIELVNLAVEDQKAYAVLTDKIISVPVGVYVMNGKSGFYALKGCKPQIFKGGANA